MANRHAMSRKKSGRVFRSGVAKVHPKNFQGMAVRGGRRL